MWLEKDNKLQKNFQFKDFKSTWKFMSAVAVLAEEHNYHPRLINEYNKVDICLSTHDSGNKITEKDRALANAIDKI